MSSKINLGNIVILKNSCVTCIWGVMSSTMIPRAACWECQTSFQTIFSDQLTSYGLKFFTNFNHCHPWLNPLLDVLPCLELKLYWKSHTHKHYIP